MLIIHQFIRFVNSIAEKIFQIYHLLLFSSVSVTKCGILTMLAAAATGAFSLFFVSVHFYNDHKNDGK